MGSSVIDQEAAGQGKKKVDSTFTPKVIIATVLMLVSGTMNTLSFKLQNAQGFKHGMVQTAFMFVGEYLNILFQGLTIIPLRSRENHYGEIVEKANKAKNKKEPNPSKMLACIPAFMDSCGSSLQVVPLLLIPASVNQMLRGGVIIFTCLFSKVFLKRQVYRHHLVGVVFLVVGFCVVGMASVLGPADDSTGAGVGGTILGIVMVLLSLQVQAGQFVVEETIVEKNQIDPKRMVGLEGSYGLMFIFLWIMIFSYIPCPSVGLCDIESYLEDPIAGVAQIFSDFWLFFWIMVTVLSIMIFNVNGLILTQNVSSVFRAFWDATRTILVWVLSLVTGIDKFDTQSFFLQMLGFALLLSGNFIYNEIIVLRCCGLDKYLKVNLDEDGNLKNDETPNRENDKFD